MKILPAALVVTLLLLSPRALRAQSAPLFTPEVSIGVGVGHVFRYEDQTFGNRLNSSGGAAVVHRSRFVLELEGNRTRQLSPDPAPCGIVAVTCIGVGHDGPRSVASLAVNLHYRFRKGETIQPYLLAGVGAMWSRSLHSTTRVMAAQAVVSEEESRDWGMGPDLGAGLRVPLTKSFSINPEVRWLEASLLSRENLAVTRATIRMTYSWQ